MEIICFSDVLASHSRFIQCHKSVVKGSDMNTRERYLPFSQYASQEVTSRDEGLLLAGFVRRFGGYGASDSFASSSKSGRN